MAVVGQYCNEHVRERVINHIIDWCNATGKEEEAAREEERQHKEANRLKREGGEELLGEFYQERKKGEDRGRKWHLFRHRAGCGAACRPVSGRDEALVPRLLKLALLARYRREDVAQEIYEEIYD